MRDEDFEISIKVVVVGNGVVGKSSMIQRYCNGIFTNEYKKTLGVDFLERLIQVNSCQVRLMLWDTAGQEEFDALTKVYYRGAQACVIVFSTTDRESFDSVKKWKKKVEHECGSIPMAVVQNKIDLISQSIVTRDEVDNLSKSIRLPLFRTSVKENLNIDWVFSFLAESYLDSLNEPCQEINHLNHYKLRTDLLPPPNPLFNINGVPNKYRRMTAAFTSKSNAPVLHHFRYKNRFHLIPAFRQSNPTIFLHHRRYRPHINHHSKKVFKNALFSSCWVL